jgi:excisionase family DNA binding protein
MDNTAERPPGRSEPELLNLKEVARLLGLHYMTVYRHVRHGRLPAERVGSMWFVRRSDAESFARGDAGSHPGEAVDWCGRLVGPLIAGDEVGAWAVVRGALSGGHEFASLHLEVVAGALGRIGVEVADGRASSVDERIAVATATRLVARLGGQFTRRGRRRGTVVLAGPSGEHHGLPLALVANLVRHAGFSVLELGTDTPAIDLIEAVSRTDDLVAVGIGVTTADRLLAAIDLIRAVRTTHPSVPVLLGGQAVRSTEIAELAGATHWSAGPDLVDTLADLAAARTRRLGSTATT